MKGRNAAPAAFARYSCADETKKGPDMNIEITVVFVGAKGFDETKSVNINVYDWRSMGVELAEILESIQDAQGHPTSIRLNRVES